MASLTISAALGLLLLSLFTGFGYLHPGRTAQCAADISRRLGRSPSRSQPLQERLRRTLGMLTLVCIAAACLLLIYL